MKGEGGVPAPRHGPPLTAPALGWRLPERHYQPTASVHRCEQRPLEGRHWTSLSFSAFCKWDPDSLDWTFSRTRGRASFYIWMETCTLNSARGRTHLSCISSRAELPSPPRKQSLKQMKKGIFAIINSASFFNSKIFLLKTFIWANFSPP